MNKKIKRKRLKFRKVIRNKNIKTTNQKSNISNRIKN